MGRVLAIDYGQRRVGLAISDPTRVLATPLPTLHRRAGKRPPFTPILTLIGEHEVDQLVVGLPLTPAGDESDWTLEVRAFGERLGERAARPVDFIDERMTSQIAERAVRSLGLPRHERERKDRVDAAAAVVILQAWLDMQRRDSGALSNRNGDVEE